jgi:hypothetical protein
MDAVRENAEWCDWYVRARGVPTGFTDDLWFATRRTPEFYPDAVTLAADVSPAAVLDRIDTSPGASVKDSFATLDLSPYGFEILFEAQWITRPAPVDPVSDWTATPDGPDVVVLTAPDGVARVTAHRSGDVVGLSNLDTSDGYGWPEALAAGFTTTGALRVWLKP